MNTTPIEPTSPAMHPSLTHGVGTTTKPLNPMVRFEPGEDASAAFERMAGSYGAEFIQGNRAPHSSTPTSGVWHKLHTLEGKVSVMTEIHLIFDPPVKEGKPHYEPREDPKPGDLLTSLRVHATMRPAKNPIHGPAHLAELRWLHETPMVTFPTIYEHHADGLADPMEYVDILNALLTGKPLARRDDRNSGYFFNGVHDNRYSPALCIINPTPERVEAGVKEYARFVGALLDHRRALQESAYLFAVGWKVGRGYHHRHMEQPPRLAGVVEGITTTAADAFIAEAEERIMPLRNEVPAALRKYAMDLATTMGSAEAKQ